MHLPSASRLAAPRRASRGRPSADNQLSQPRDVRVRVPVGLPSGVASYAVYDRAAQPVASQLLPLSAVDASLRTEYYNYSSALPPAAVQWLAFVAAVSK